MDCGLRGRVALVTDAASGIGRATAELFARNGARVVASDVNAEAGAAEVAGAIAWPELRCGVVRDGRGADG